MIVLIVDDGTLFDLQKEGNVMRGEKDSTGRELLREDADNLKYSCNCPGDIPQRRQTKNVV